MNSYKIHFIENAEEPYMTSVTYLASNIAEAATIAENELLPRQFESILNIMLVV